MDDFRVGSVPSSERYGDRHPYGSAGRKRQKHHDDEHGGSSDEPADTFEETADGVEQAAPDDQVEDYYLPSKPAEDE